MEGGSRAGGSESTPIFPGEENRLVPSACSRDSPSANRGPCPLRLGMPFSAPPPSPPAPKTRTCFWAPPGYRRGRGGDINKKRCFARLRNNFTCFVWQVPGDAISANPLSGRGGRGSKTGLQLILKRWRGASPGRSKRRGPAQEVGEPRERLGREPRRTAPPSPSPYSALRMLRILKNRATPKRASRTVAMIRPVRRNLASWSAAAPAFSTSARVRSPSPSFFADLGQRTGRGRGFGRDEDGVDVLELEYSAR